MDSIIFNNGTILEANSLNELQERKAEAIKNRFTDIRSYGVINEKSPEQIVYVDSAGIGIWSLTAYDPTGERIYIAPNQNNNQLPAVSGLLPETELDGGLLIYGGYKIPAQQTFTLVINYKEVQAPPITHHVTTGQMFLTESNSSYDLYLRKTNDIRENDIVLATITTDANGNLAADESVRTVSSVSASTVIGSISGTTSTDGGYGEDISFEDHINSVGTGTVSTTNPHGISAADLGVDIAAMGNHQKLLHSDGIRSDNIDSTVSAMYPSYVGETLSDSEVVYIQPLSTALNEMAVINGISVMPANFGSIYSYSFQGRANDTDVGFYLFVYNVNNYGVEIYGPYPSESDTTFNQLLNTPTLFPICSLEWAYLAYDVTFDQVSDTGSYGIVPSSFKDRRVFNNTSLANFRPDESFALSQFAPIANDVAYIHNVRLQSTEKAAFYPVSGRSIEFTIIGSRAETDDGDTSTVSVTFTGANPLPIKSIVDQLLSAFVATDTNGNTFLRAYPRITEDGYLSISAPLGISISQLANGAAELLGFAAASGNMSAESDGLIKEMIYYGDRSGIIIFTYNDNDDVTNIDYYLGGGQVKRNIFSYSSDGYITHVNEIIEKL